MSTRKHRQEPEPNTLGARMAAARIAAGLTQAEMAARILASRQSVINWEQNRRRPYARALADWSTVTGVSVRDLVTDTDEVGNQTIPEPRRWSQPPEIRSPLGRWLQGAAA